MCVCVCVCVFLCCDTCVFVCFYFFILYYMSVCIMFCVTYVRCTTGVSVQFIQHGGAPTGLQLRLLPQPSPPYYQCIWCQRARRCSHSHRTLQRLPAACRTGSVSVSSWSKENGCYKFIVCSSNCKGLHIVSI